MSRNKFEVKNEGSLINKTLGDSNITIPVEANVFWVKFVKKSSPVIFKTGESWLYDFAAMRRYPCASAWQFEDYKKIPNGYLTTTTIKSVEKINKDKIILHNPTEADIRLILKRPDSTPPAPGSGYSPASVSPRGSGAGGSGYGVSGAGGEPLSSSDIILIPTYIGKWTVNAIVTTTATFDSRYAPFNAHQNVYVASGPPTVQPSGTTCIYDTLLASYMGSGMETFKNAKRQVHRIRYKPTIGGGERFMGFDTPYTPIHGGGGSIMMNAIHGASNSGGIWIGQGRKSGHFQYVDGKWTSFPDDPPVAQGSISAVIKSISVSPDPGFLPFDIYYLSDPGGSGDPGGSDGGGGGGGEQPSHSQAGEKLPKKKSDIIDAPNSKYTAEIYFNNTKIYETSASEMLCTFPIKLIGSLPDNDPETTDDDDIPNDWVHPLDVILDDFSWSDKIGSNWGLFPGKISEILITNREKFDFDKTKGVDEMLEPLVPNSLNLYSNTKVYSLARDRHIFLLLEGAIQQTKLKVVGEDFYIDRNCNNNYCCFQFKRLTVIEVNGNSPSVKYYPIRDGKITGLPEWIKEIDYDGFLNPYFFFPTSNNLCRTVNGYNGGVYGLNTQGIHKIGAEGVSPYFISREIPIPNKDNNFNSSFSCQRFSKFYVGANSYKPGNIKFIYGFPFGVYYNYSDFYANGEINVYGLGTGIVTDDVIRYYNNINHSKNNLYIAAKIGASEENVSIDNFNLGLSFPVQDTIRVGEMIGSKIFRDSLKNGTAKAQFKIAKTEKINNDAKHTIRNFSKNDTINIYGFYPGYTGNLTNPAWITPAIFQGISDNYAKSFNYPNNKYYGYSGLVYLQDDNIYANRSKRQKFPYISDSEKVFNFLPETKFQLSTIVKLPKINGINDKSLIYFVTAIRTDDEEEKERNDYVDPFSMTLEQRLALRD
jgi:hypothetical protein